MRLPLLLPVALVACTRSSAPPAPLLAPAMPPPPPALTPEQLREQATAIARRAAQEAARVAPACEGDMPQARAEALRGTALAFASQNCRAAPWCFTHTLPPEEPGDSDDVSTYCSATRAGCEESRTGMRGEPGRLSRCAATERLWCADFSASARQCFPSEETCQRHIARAEFRNVQRGSCTERPTWPGAGDQSTREACVPHVGYAAPGALESLQQTAERVLFAHDGDERPRRLEVAFAGEFCGQPPAAWCYSPGALTDAYLHCEVTQQACELRRAGELGSRLGPCEPLPQQVWCVDLGVGRRCFADQVTCARRAALVSRAGGAPVECTPRRSF